MLIWNLVFNQVATLQEIETHWSYTDVLKANAVLNYKHALDRIPPKKGKVK